MALQVQPVRLEDFDDLISHAVRFKIGDDLVANPVPTCWPIASREEAVTRATWHFGRQRNRFEQDGTAHFLKVIDADSDNEIIGLARWHYYPRGYQFEGNKHWEPLSPEERFLTQGTWNHALHDAILNYRDSHRSTWIDPNDGPCWILTHLVTRQSHRRRGAARLLVRWGILKAEEMQVPAYLESGPLGLELYRGMGFREVGDPADVSIDQSGGSFRLVNMAYIPGLLYRDDV